MVKRDVWLVRNVPGSTRIKIKTYAAQHKLTISEALTKLVKDK